MMQVGCPYDTTSRPSNKHITNGITNTYYRYTYIDREMGRQLYDG